MLAYVTGRGRGIGLAIAQALEAEGYKVVGPKGRSELDLLDPEAVILSGGMSRAVGITEELRTRVMKYLPLPVRPVFKLLLSELGSSAAVIGAASLDASL